LLPVQPVQAGICLPLNEIGETELRNYVQKQTNHRPNEDPTDRARLDNAYTSAANDANGRKFDEGATTKAKADKDASSPCRESENNAAQLLADTAGSSEGMNPA